MIDTKNKIETHMQGKSIFHQMGDICNTGVVMSPEERATTAYEYFELHEECTDISVVDQENVFIGLLTKSDFMHVCGGRYGYRLNERKAVADLIVKEVLIVQKEVFIETASIKAMTRAVSHLYDPIVVLEENKFVGLVTIRDLLMATVSIEVEKANETNPLTTLPGNKMIDQEIHKLIGSKEFFAIMYLDLDNFKAYNDAYGFPNGDRMIEMLADAMRFVYGDKAFLGHVGGDDFVIITRECDVKERANQIIHFFKDSIRGLYNKTDWERGYILAQNRKGIVEQFPIASVSIAIITNQINRYERMMELTEQIVTVKKKAKQVGGNSIVIL